VCLLSSDVAAANNCRGTVRKLESGRDKEVESHVYSGNIAVLNNPFAVR